MTDPRVESQPNETLIKELRIWAAMASIFIGDVEPRDAQEADTQAGLLNSLGSLGVHKLEIAP